MAQNLGYLKETPSQTAGPYVHIGLMPAFAGFDMFNLSFGAKIAGADVEGERIEVCGTIIDSQGAKVKDALIEVWQANSKGIYKMGSESESDVVEPGFRGWGRAATSLEDGEWSFETVKPGCVHTECGNKQAPHINFWIVARGINIGLSTRMYFEDEVNSNQLDPVLNAVLPENRRNTLIAQRNDKNGKPVYRFDIVLKGENETVFFDI